MVLKNRHSDATAAAAAHNSMLGFLIRNRKEADDSIAKDVDKDDKDKDNEKSNSNNNGKKKNRSNGSSNLKIAAAAAAAADVANDIRPVKRQRVADPSEVLSPRHSESGVVKKEGESDVFRVRLDGCSPGRNNRNGRNEEGCEQSRHNEARSSVVGSRSVVEGDAHVCDDGRDDDRDNTRERQNENEMEKEKERQIRTTDLESAMPSFAEIEDVAVKEYEAFRTSQQEKEEEKKGENERNSGVAEAKEYESIVGATTRVSDDEDKQQGTNRSKNRWIKGMSSIYVDAFKLALETVLDEEAHLFEEREKSIFTAWKELSYEAQYL